MEVRCTVCLWTDDPSGAFDPGALWCTDDLVRLTLIDTFLQYRTMQYQAVACDLPGESHQNFNPLYVSYEAL